MIGLINKETIYLKTDEDQRRGFRARRFQTVQLYPRQKVRPAAQELPYWRLPERLYDDPDELAVWARRAFETAERKKAKAGPSVKRKAAKKSRRK